MSRPYILISNDDGVTAKGINFLIDTLRPVADLLVMAPDSPRSGFGCSISSTIPIRYKVLREEPGLTVCSCTGTPVDCIKVALNVFTDRKPDLIVGGINHGDNSSVNTHYSGTMGVATEGALQGYPSVAFSLCDHREDADFTPLAPYLVNFVHKAIVLGLPPFTCLNINFPRRAKFEGVRICRMAHSRWQNELTRCQHPRGGDYFWLVGDCCELEPEATDTDRWALAHGYVAVTPTRLDVTDTGLLEVLDGIF
ncbi:MAG: 5'/3'-nucleotidase SurE [Bacteroidales bacterium]|nr:5'/3'-nucleotidase SurE [Bacteroidales bacterium]